MNESIARIKTIIKMNGCSYTNFTILSHTYWKEFKIWFRRDSINIVRQSKKAFYKPFIILNA